MPGKRRKGGIQSRGTTKKEEPEKEKTACSDCWAGRSSDRSSYRVIEKTNLNRPYMVDAILILAPLRYIPSPRGVKKCTGESGDIGDIAKIINIAMQIFIWGWRSLSGM